MPRFKVAHIREQGVDLIIVPLDSSVDYQTQEEQQAVADELQLRARAAGLAGTAVPVWDHGGRLGFFAPQGFHPFFRGLSMDQVLASINRELFW